MTAPARLLCPPRPMPDNPDPDPLAEIARLTRQIRSYETRLASYAAALNRQLKGEPVDASHVTYVTQPGLVALAEQLEAQGRVAVVRFHRNGRGQIVTPLALELAVLVPDEPDEAQLTTLTSGVAVVAGDDA